MNFKYPRYNYCIVVMQPLPVCQILRMVEKRRAEKASGGWHDVSAGLVFLGRVMLLGGCIQEAAMLGCFVRVGSSRDDEIGLKV